MADVTIPWATAILPSVWVSFLDVTVTEGH